MSDHTAGREHPARHGRPTVQITGQEAGPSLRSPALGGVRRG